MTGYLGAKRWLHPRSTNSPKCNRRFPAPASPAVLRVTEELEFIGFDDLAKILGTDPAEVSGRNESVQSAPRHSVGGTKMNLRTSVKAGGLPTVNHNQGLKVRSSVKAGGLNVVNHNQGLKVRSSVKAGGLSAVNHNQTLV